MSGEEQRDRELENILGQFLVATFQSDKLAEMILDKLSFRPNRELKIFLPAKGAARTPYLITVKIEPYPFQQAKKEERVEGAVKAVGLLESPPLLMDATKLRESINDMLGGSLEWWTHQGSHRELKLEDWKVNISIIDAKDVKKLSSVYTLLGNLEARRKGEITR